MTKQEQVFDAKGRKKQREEMRETLQNKSRKQGIQVT